jgi:hypothetical protein
MKDFANSFEQMSWKNAVASYYRWLPFTSSQFEGVRTHAEMRIAELVKEWPQLDEGKK